MGDDSDAGRYAGPLDDADPRYGAATARPHPRRLVASPPRGPDPDSPSARFARIVIPVVAVAALLVVGVVFVVGLSPGSTVAVVGETGAVLRAVRDEPRRVCWRDSTPCAWLTAHDGSLLALSTSGPLSGEQGRQGITWCASSGRFVAATTGSVYDAAGHLVRGPAPRGLDRYRVATDDGRVVIDFGALSTGAPAGEAGPLQPAVGPDCAVPRLDPAPDLRLGDSDAARSRPPRSMGG